MNIFCNSVCSLYIEKLIVSKRHQVSKRYFAIHKKAGGGGDFRPEDI